MPEIVRYEQMRVAVANCRRVDEAKAIADKALALRMYAQQVRDPEMEIWLAEIRLRARRRVGELAREFPRSKGGANPAATLSTGEMSKGEALKEARLTAIEAHRCELLSRIPEDEIEALIARCREERRAKREENARRCEGCRRAGIART